MLSELERLLEHAQERRARGADPSTLLPELLFSDLGFEREVESTDLSFVLLSSVLRQRRGNCVGLGTLYLALCEGLGLAAWGVLRPGHFYVRQHGSGAPHNVELLRRGEAMSDAWYARRFPVPPGAGSYYAKPLSTDQVLGVIEYDVGNERRRQARYVEAEAAFSRAVSRFPTFAEAHASLGTMQHLLGKLPPAAASYRAARALNWSLPGLADNIALLEAELRAAD